MLCDHNTGQGRLRSPGEKGKKKNRDLELRYMFLGQIFAKNVKNDPKALFEASKSVKKNKIQKIMQSCNHNSFLSKVMGKNV